MKTSELENRRQSAFSAKSFTSEIDRIYDEIRTLYMSDEIPWVVGYSGGKDSTATLQLVWYALADLSEEKRTKPVHVISTDTLVENPIVAMWVSHSLRKIAEEAENQNLPIKAHRLTPDLKDSYWVNLIGRGYPAPRPKFRWCTSRLKINPSNRFITEVVKTNGEAILVLGTRKAESAIRSANMKKWESSSTRDLLSAHGQLDRSWVYTPVADWSNDDVWLYLNQVANPWGFTNKNLLGMYQGATEDGECPLVVDTSTPSCGDSRFGCFVCTLVEKDKSMQAMIQNDEEKEWMLPLMEFRNKWLDIKEDRQHRDFRKMDGSIMFFNDRLVHGPYKQDYRERMLAAVLAAQRDVRDLGPPEVAEFTLIRVEELEEIRRIWVTEKHEVEDRLPAIYEQVLEEKYPGPVRPSIPGLSQDQLTLLKAICQEEEDPDDVLFQVTRELLHVEHQYRTMARRAGLYPALEKAVEKSAFLSEQEAEEFARRRSEALADSTED